MRVLFDENLTWSLAKDLVDHECRSVAQMGWRGLKNGTLLTRAESVGFQILLTLDDDIQPEQNMTGRNIAILVLKPARQGKQAARDMAARIRECLPEIKPGEIRTLGIVD